MKAKFKYLFILFFTGLVCFTFIACEDDDDNGNPRLFKPTDLSLNTQYDGFVAKWKVSFGAEGYQLEASLTEDFEEIDAIMNTDAQTLTTTFKKMKENVRYYVRLKGTRTDSNLDSKYIYGQVTTGTASSIFYPVNVDSISFSSALLTWRDVVDADHLGILNTSGENTVEVNQPVSQADNKAKKIRVSNLEHGASYKVTLYKGDESFGYTMFTVPARPTDMITLSVADKDNLQNILDNAAEGATILFAGTAPFDYSNKDITISKSVTLMGEPGVAKPKLYIKNLLIGGRSAGASINIGEVKLERLELSGYKLSGTSELTSSEPNACAVTCDFSQTKEVTLNKLTVNDCVIRNFANSFLELNDKLKTAGTKARFGEINVNRVLVYDMGRDKMSYPSFISITNKNDKNGFCKKYVIRNSTFHHLLRGIIEARVFTTIDGYSNPDVLVESCTFDVIGIKPEPGNLWYGTNTEITKSVFDFKATDVVTDIKVTINNCIWGEMTNEKISNQFFQGVTGTMNNSYMLAGSKAIISGGTLFMNAISGSADELFPKRASGIYEVGSTGAVKEVGDPRWK